MDDLFELVRTGSNLVDNFAQSNAEHHGLRTHDTQRLMQAIGSNKTLGVVTSRRRSTPSDSTDVNQCRLDSHLRSRYF